ncbi:MAG TPA: hypothetical protein ENG27_01580 [Candidatus Bathyarchaeota archaeon]|nr:MAG: hypothetical protein DRO48_02845 [Candidatus Bathyarchaeota archaeon]HDM26989.1 hypothetical protein [Candidatus Bathyarchaeota archaeon]
MTSLGLKEMLRELLLELNRGGLAYASAIVSRDGLLMASAMPEDVDAETFAAMTATMVGAAETAFSELKRGAAERVIVEGPRAKIVAVGAGKEALLVVMAEPDAMLGLLLHQMGKTVEKIKKLI